jgi:hypothetical protein
MKEIFLLIFPIVSSIPSSLPWGTKEEETKISRRRRRERERRIFSNQFIWRVRLKERREGEKRRNSERRERNTFNIKEFSNKSRIRRERRRREREKRKRNCCCCYYFEIENSSFPIE